MKKIQIGLRIKSDLNDKLILIAEEKDISKNSLINQIIKNYINNLKNEKGIEQCGRY